jgi:hypothetical protein
MSTTVMNTVEHYLKQRSKRRKHPDIEVTHTLKKLSKSR